MLVTQSCPTLCDPMDCSPPGSSVHEILQARILEWVAISFSRGSSQPRDWTRVCYTAGRFFTNWATREYQFYVAHDLWARNAERALLPCAPGVPSARVPGTRGSIFKMASWLPQFFLALFCLQILHPSAGVSIYRSDSYNRVWGVWREFAILILQMRTSLENFWQK